MSEYYIDAFQKLRKDSENRLSCLVDHRFIYLIHKALYKTDFKEPQKVDLRCIVDKYRYYKTLELLLNRNIIIDRVFLFIKEYIIFKVDPQFNKVYSLRLILKKFKLSNKEIIELTRLAIIYRDNDCAIYLLNQFQNPGLVFNNRNQSFLHLASQVRNLDILKYLLEDKKVTPNTVSINFSTPLSEALERNEETNRKIVDLLLKHNANVHLLSYELQKTFLFKHHKLIVKLINTLDIEFLYEALDYAIQEEHINLIKERLFYSWTPLLKSEIPKELLYHVKNYI